MPQLGVNIDHIATLRQARQEIFPDPIKAAHISISSGADSIVCHLRQDRRHIQDKDLYRLKEEIKGKLNLEMSTIDEIVQIALQVKPHQVTLVPERREELTTEGGLDVVRYKKKISKVVSALNKKGIIVSLFIDPQKLQVKASKDTGAAYVELHTGAYANTRDSASRARELKRIIVNAFYAESIRLGVNAGHGLDYKNVKAIADISVVEELNIGFSIIAESIFLGLAEAVKKMKHIIRRG